MEQLYKPVLYEKREGCVHNSAKSESARLAFQSAVNVRLEDLEIGRCAFLVIRVEDGTLRFVRTSVVEDVSENDGELRITTGNSIYVLSKCECASVV